MPQTINNMVQEWTNALTTYTAIKMNIPTDVSAAGSLLMDLQVGGSSRFRVDKNGDAYPRDIYVGLSRSVYMQSPNGTIVWNNDTTIGRRAAANLRLGAADAAGSAIAISSVASNQLTLASNHGLTTGAAIIITGTAAPSGTSLNTRYYARVIAAAVIELYSTYDQATAASGTTGIIAVTTAGTSASVRLATPFQSFGVQDFTGTDIPGQPFIIRGSRGTGTGPGGDLVFQVAPAGTTGSVQNALETVLTINSNRTVSIGGLTINPANGANTFSQVPGIVLQTSNALILRHGNSDGVVVRPVSSGTANLIFADTLNATQTALWGEAINTLALRNGANAQTFRVYNTTDGTNSEFGKIAWSSNVLQIGTEKAGTGTARALEFQTDGVTRMTIGTTGNVTIPVALFLNSSAIIAILSRFVLSSPANGIVTLLNSAQTDFDRLQFGGTTSAFPALKRVSATLDVRLADDSGYAGLNCGAMTPYGSIILRGSTESTRRLIWNGIGMIKAQSDGVFTWQNDAQTDFGRLQFGGTDANFPALKRSSTTLQARLADDSGFASVQGKLTTETAYTAGAPTATGYLIIYDSNGTAYRVPAVAN